MGDIAPPPLEAASSNDELASKGSELSTASPAGSDKTLTPPRLRSASNVEPQLGRGSAIFSTDLGRRAPRRLQSPPYAPVLVRSDIVRDVVTAAGYWRSKYPRQYLCIFPQAGWQIGDLWDKEDVHRETEPFCKEVLRFIERDNCVRAQNYVQDWSKLHPERLPIVGGDMTELYDKSNPLSVVDKIFFNEERRQYPPIFLWHVAHIMRTTMLTVKGAKLPVKKPSVLERLDTGHKDPVVHGTAPVPAAVESIAVLPAAPSITAASSTHVVNPAASMSGQQPIPAWHSDRTSPPFLSDAPPAHARFADPIEGGSYAEPVGHMMPGIPGHEVSGPNAAHSGLHVPRNRSARSASGTYNQTVPSSLYVENMPRAPSGHGPRQHANPMPATQSPRFNQAHMTLNHPMVKIHHGILPFAHEQARMTPGMIAGQAHAPGVMHPGMMPPHAMQNPSMTHGYTRQPSGLQGTPYAAPMGDMTNMHYSPGMPSQNIDPRHPGDRRFSQQHGNGSALYDPYEGSNPAFRTVGYSSGKKYSQNGLHNSNGRQRKTSFPGSRPYHSQYTNDRPGLLQMGGNRFFGPKPDREDDPAITQDQEYGCYIDWIGPRNETVNELFVKDLPENIQDAELEALFLGRLGVKPTSVKVKSAEHAQYAQGRKHAFVGFPDAAIAKQAFLMRDPTIRGLPVSITVPKRFFQKTVDVQSRDTIEAGSSAYSRYTSNPNNREGRNRVSSINQESDVTASTAASKDNLSYSPQDARSDLPKKKKGKQPQQAHSAAGSPEIRKAKPKKRQESPTKEKLAEPTEAVQNGTLNEVIKADDHTPVSDTAQGTRPTFNTQSEQPQASENTSSNTEKKSPTVAEDGNAVHGADNNGASSTKDQQQEVLPQRVESQPQPKVELHIESVAKQSPAKQPVEVEQTAVEPAPTAPLVVEDEASEDELKNDASFHSAAESQSDLEVKAKPVVSSDSTNQGTTTLALKTTTTTDVFSPTPPVSTIIAVPEDIVLPSEDTVVPAAAGSEPSTSELKPTTMSPADSKAAEVSAATEQEVVSSTTVPTISEPAKKGGAQHTESLHPFSKASKAQMRKEKEQKRKAQKKEREQAEKAKAAKAAASKSTAKSALAENSVPTKVNGIAEKEEVSNEIKIAVEKESVETKEIHCADKEPSASTQEATGASSSVKKPAPAAKTSKGAGDSRDKPGKRKGNKVDTTVTDDAATAENKDEDHGKQTGGSISIPNETGSVTNKEVKANLPEDGLVSDAQFSKQEDVKDVSSSTKEPDPVGTITEEPTPSAKRKNKKKRKAAPRVWPDLEFRPKSPNPPWMGQIDTATDVQHYDEIINKACGGEEDSDFSWSDLPKMPESEGEEQIEDDKGDEDGDDDLDVDATDKRITELLAQQAATPSGSLNHVASRFLNSETVQASAAPREDVAERVMAALETHIAATKKEYKAASVNPAVAEAQLAPRTGAQEPSDTVTADSQPIKKKKPNNRRNKKKKKAAENAETAEASNIGDTAVTTKLSELTSNKATEDSIDSDDPFYDQLKGIEAIKRGDHGPTNTQETDSQRHAEAAKSVTEPQMMRTMEAYFKETGRNQSKGRKVSKEDLR